ncbi:MAG: DsbA family protein [Pseudomonadota bacterium]
MLKFVSLTLALMISTAASAQTLDEDRIKELALQAIMENPQIIMEAVALLEAQQREQQALAAATVLDGLGDDPNAPILGNPDGDVVVVEFFDYNCPYCRRAGEVVEQLIAADPNVKVVLREWPILGDASVVAARASLAARNQDQYAAFHWALMKAQGRASEATVMRLARDLGMDVDQLQTDMASDSVNEHIAKSTELARAMGFTGTPAFVIGDQLAPGLISVDDMIDLIENARAG